MSHQQIPRSSPPTMATSNKRKLIWTPTRQFIILLLTFAVLLNSLSLFSSVAISGCNDSSYTGDALSVRGMYSTALAKNQSNGYFNDILDASWKRMQQRARSSVQYKYPKEPEKGYMNMKLWYLNNLQVSA
jgi:hypothetical protein